jgi:hypothetical protein
MVSEAEREATAQQHGHERLAASEASLSPGVSAATCLRTPYGDLQPATTLSPIRASEGEAGVPDGNECEVTDSRRVLALAGSYSAGLPTRGYDWFRWRPSIRRQPVRMYPVG